MRIVQSVILFLQDQVLGMQWLKDMFAAFLQAIGVDIQSRLGASLHFFFYDVVKITLLLCLLIFLISYIQSYFPPEKSRSIEMCIRDRFFTNHLLHCQIVVNLLWCQYPVLLLH